MGTAVGCRSKAGLESQGGVAGTKLLSELFFPFLCVQNTMKESVRRVGPVCFDTLKSVSNWLLNTSLLKSQPSKASY